MKEVTFKRVNAKGFGEFIAALEQGNVSYSIAENATLAMWTVTIVGAKI